MKKKFCMATMFVLATATGVIAEDRGEPTPQRVIRRCTHRAAHVTHRTVHHLGHLTRRAVTVINMLKAQGRDDAAAMVAENARQEVAEAAGRGVGRLAELGATCAEALEALGAPDEAFQLLAQRMERFADAIQAAGSRSVAAIDAALAGE